MNDSGRLAVQTTPAKLRRLVIILTAIAAVTCCGGPVALFWIDCYTADLGPVEHLPGKDEDDVIQELGNPADEVEPRAK
jgi:hypothetical protein